jgi:hypothetical protein
MCAFSIYTENDTGNHSSKGVLMGMTPVLRLIRGDLDRVVRLGNASIQIAPLERPPFSVDAVAVEQDTALVLDEEPLLYAPSSRLSDLSTEMEHFSEPLPGSVVVQRGRPKRLYAIIHDLEQEPTWRSEWILSALGNLLRQAEQQSLRALALPLLGCRFGQLEPWRFIDLLCQALQQHPPTLRLKLWLVAPRYETHVLLCRLQRCQPR